MNLTVTRLARECKLSRSTILYYESIGLLRRPRRSDGNYRVYGEKDLDRLRFCVYRDAGLALADIRAVLDAPTSDAGAVLRRRMAELNVGIERMREHQSPGCSRAPANLERIRKWSPNRSGPRS